MFGQAVTQTVVRIGDFWRYTNLNSPDTKKPKCIYALSIVAKYCQIHCLMNEVFWMIATFCSRNIRSECNANTLDTLGIYLKTLRIVTFNSTI